MSKFNWKYIAKTNEISYKLDNGVVVVVVIERRISAIWAIYRQEMGTWQEYTVPPRFKRADAIGCSR